MTYNPNIPQAGTKIKNTYNLVQTNFSEADRIFNINHYQFSNLNTSLQGKHRFCSLVEQSAGGPVTLANEMALFTGDQGGFTELFLKREGNPVLSIPMTCRNITPTYALDQGETFLPGAFILKWGVITTAIATVTFTTQFPTACYGVTITIASTGVVGSPAACYATNLGPASFIIRNTNDTVQRMFWIAIGN